MVRKTCSTAVPDVARRGAMRGEDGVA